MIILFCVIIVASKLFYEASKFHMVHVRKYITLNYCMIINLFLQGVKVYMNCSYRFILLSSLNKQDYIYLLPRYFNNGINNFYKSLLLWPRFFIPIIMCLLCLCFGTKYLNLYINPNFEQSATVFAKVAQFVHYIYYYCLCKLHSIVYFEHPSNKVVINFIDIYFWSHNLLYYTFVFFFILFL